MKKEKKSTRNIVRKSFRISLVVSGRQSSWVTVTTVHVNAITKETTVFRKVNAGHFLKKLRNNKRNKDGSKFLNRSLGPV